MARVRGGYPLANIQKTIENGHLFLTYPFKIVISIVILVCQRVCRKSGMYVGGFFEQIRSEQRNNSNVMSRIDDRLGLKTRIETKCKTAVVKLTL